MKLGLGLMLALLGISAGCTPIMGKPHGLAIYSNLQFNEHSTDNVVGSKHGEACASNVLGIIASGDASAATAAKTAGITKIATVDGKATNILFFYSTYCVVVTGE